MPTCRVAPRKRRITLTFVAAIACSGPSLGQDNPEAAEIREQIRALRAEQARITELQRQVDASLRALEARLDTTHPGPSLPAPEPSQPSTVAAAAGEPRLEVSGDLRLRAQGDRSDDADQLSGQLRGRLAATYALNDRITIGGRLATGDSGDPRSTDVQLSNWNDDLEVSLDMAYARFDLGNLQLYGGKFPQPFIRTDLVWDGDVNPQGAAATYRLPTPGGGAFLANGLFFPVDVGAGRSDSTMAGVQFGYDSPVHGGFGYTVSGGYYSYDLGQPAARHVRGNRLDVAGGYLSDYRLFNVITALSWQGADEKWPIRIVGDYVRNLGAVDDEDTGYEISASIGRAAPGNWRFSYGYARTDADAVLAAFSHDNIAIATNYQLHTMTVDYGLTPNTSIGGIWYRFRPNDPEFAGSNDPSKWIDRLRLFYLVSF